MSDAHIFISYSRRDGNDYATQLEQALKDKSYAVWRDIRNIRPDQDFTADIEKGIEAASHVLVCLTPDTKRDNSFVRREIQYALALGKPVFPLRFKEMEPHISIINNEWIDFFRDWDKALLRVCEIIAESPYQNQPQDREDIFRPYLQFLYQQVVAYLKQAVISEIELRAADTPDAVPQRPPESPVFDLLLRGLAIGKDENETPIANFAEGFARYEGRVLLLGEPGAGKTITLMTYAREAVAARLENLDLPLPLLGTIALWDADKQIPLVTWLTNLYPKFLADTGIREALNNIVDNGQTLLLLDGLDELGSQRPLDPQDPKKGYYDPRLRFIETLAKVAKNQMLITCRVQDYQEIGQQVPLRGAITLQPLDNHQIKTYLHDQPELRELLEIDGTLREIARTPLLLSLFAYAYQKMSEAERTELTHLEDAGDVRDKIFETYIQRRYEHEKRKPYVFLPFTLKDIYAVLGRAAMRNAGSLIAVENLITTKDFREKLSDELLPDFVDVAIALHLITPTHTRREDGRFLSGWRFIHVWLRDYFGYLYCLPRLESKTYYQPFSANPARALSKIADSRVWKPLLKELSNDDVEIRRHISTALGRLKDPRTVEALLVALQDEDAEVRGNAAHALGRLGDPRTVEALLVALQDEDAEVRGNAAHALGRLGDPRAVRSLIEMLSDGILTMYGRIKDIAAQALDEIGTPDALEATRKWKIDNSGRQTGVHDRLRYDK